MIGAGTSVGSRTMLASRGVASATAGPAKPRAMARTRALAAVPSNFFLSGAPVTCSSSAGGGHGHQVAVDHRPPIWPIDPTGVVLPTQTTRREDIWEKRVKKR